MINKSHMILGAGVGVGACVSFSALISLAVMDSPPPPDPGPIRCELAKVSEPEVARVIAEAPLMAPAEVPRHFEGRFEWDTGGIPQQLALDVARVEQEGARLIVTGRGSYTTVRTARFSFKMHVEPDGSFQMWESNPDVADFITEGVHRGTFDVERRAVRARWHGEDGRQGVLEFRAVDARQAEPQTSQHHQRVVDGVLISSAHAEGCGVSWRQQVLVGGHHVEPLEVLSSMSDAARRALCVGDQFSLPDDHAADSIFTGVVLEGEVPTASSAVGSAPANAEDIGQGVRLLSIVAGDGERCVRSDEDRVTTHYVGWNEEGVFDSSYKRGRAATFSTNRVIEGWRLALGEMCEGDYARVWIPAALAYGEQAGGGRPSGDLVFDIEVSRVGFR